MKDHFITPAFFSLTVPQMQRLLDLHPLLSAGKKYCKNEPVCLEFVLAVVQEIRVFFF